MDAQDSRSSFCSSSSASDIDKAITKDESNTKDNASTKAATEEPPHEVAVAVTGADGGGPSSPPLTVASGWRACFTLGERAHPGMALFVMCMYTFFSGVMAQGVIPSILTTIQASYGLSSYQAGWIVSAADIAVCVLLIPIGIWGANGSIPRFLTISTIFYAGGAVLFGLPYFIYGEFNSTPSAFAMLVAANAIMGGASTTQYVLCNVYFSMIVSKRRLPLYNATYTAMSTLGPAIGFLVGGACSYSDIWWTPFFACAFGLFASAIAGLFLPRRRDRSLIIDDTQDPIQMCCFPQKYKESLEKESNVSAVDHHIVNYFGDIEQKDLTFVGIFRLFFTIMVNPTIFFTVMLACAGGFIIGAVVTFAPSFSQTSFALDPESAAMYFGATAIPGAVVGVLLGGIITKQANAANAGVLFLAMVSSIVAIPLTPIFLIPSAAAFFPLLVVLEIVSFLPSGLIPTIISRTVEPKHRSLTLSFQSLMSRVLGTIPGPIIMGELMDQQCLQYSTTGNNCLVYDVEGIRILFFIVVICSSVIAAVGSTMAWLSWRRHTRIVAQQVTGAGSANDTMASMSSSMVPLAPQVQSDNAQESSASA